MMRILHYPDPRLTAKNASLSGWTEEAAAKVEEMRTVLAKVDGVGLAAPQVGWNVKLFIIELFDKENGEQIERVIFNPAIKHMGSLVPMKEGCLSFPGVWATIKRYERVELIGTTPEGPIDEVLTGFSAQAAQHEMDHLDGILFIERMTAADQKFHEKYLRDAEESWGQRKDM